MNTETLQWWKGVADVATVGLAFLTAVAGAVALLTGREIDRRRTTAETELQNRIATSEAAATAARREADNLRERFAPRVLTAVQRATIVERLKGITGRVSMIYPADQEAQAFAKQLQAAIAAAGWEVKTEASISVGPDVGLSVRVKSTDTPPVIARALHTALTAALGPLPMTASGNLAEDAVLLDVGSKPAGY